MFICSAAVADRIKGVGYEYIAYIATPEGLGRNHGDVVHYAQIQHYSIAIALFRSYDMALLFTISHSLHIRRRESQHPFFAANMQHGSQLVESQDSQTNIYHSPSILYL
jgi:hypothetical protein